MTRRLPLIAALAGLAVIAAVLGAVLAQDKPPVLGGNNEFVGGPHFTVAIGGEVCQPSETVPAGTAIVRARAGGITDATALAVAVRAEGRTLASSEVRWDGRERDLDFRLDRVIREDTPATVCFRSTTASAPFIWSAGRGGNVSAYAGDYTFNYRVRLAYLERDRETWLAGAGDTASRMATARAAILDGWAPWGALAAMLVALGIIVAAVRRELRS